MEYMLPNYSNSTKNADWRLFFCLMPQRLLRRKIKARGNFLPRAMLQKVLDSLRSLEQYSSSGHENISCEHSREVKLISTSLLQEAFHLAFRQLRHALVYLLQAYQPQEPLSSIKALQCLPHFQGLSLLPL